MRDRPELSLIGFVLDAPDAREFADFYRRPLGWETVQDDPEWYRARKRTVIVPSSRTV